MVCAPEKKITASATLQPMSMWDWRPNCNDPRYAGFVENTRLLMLGSSFKKPPNFRELRSNSASKLLTTLVSENQLNGFADTLRYGSKLLYYNPYIIFHVEIGKINFAKANEYECSNNIPKNVIEYCDEFLSFEKTILENCVKNFDGYFWVNLWYPSNCPDGKKARPALVVGITSNNDYIVLSQSRKCSADYPAHRLVYNTVDFQTDRVSQRYLRPEYSLLPMSQVSERDLTALERLRLPHREVINEANNLAIAQISQQIR